MAPRFPSRRARLVIGILLILALLAGCSAVEISDLLGDSTPTTDPTLLAVPAMLTQTAASAAAARAATRTPTPTSSPTPEPTIQIPETGSREAPALPGQRIQTGPYALFVLPPKNVQAVGTHKASAGRAYLDVPVVLQNTGSAPVPYTALFFSLGDFSTLQNQGSGPKDAATKSAASGAILQPVSINSPQSPALLSGDLAPGETVRGHLFFDIPEKGAAYAVTFDPRSTAALSAAALSAESGVWVDLTQPGSADGLPTNETAVGLPGLGKRVEKSGEALTVQSVTARQTYGRYKAANGDLFVELNVVIENVRLTSVSYNADYFHIKDSLGYEYPTTVIPSETLLLAGSLMEGHQVSGHVIFEIPANLKGLVVSYQPVVIGQDFEPIRVQVDLPAPH